MKKLSLLLLLCLLHGVAFGAAADKKVSELTEKSNPVAGDLIPLVDSEVTTNKSKRATVQNIAGALLSIDVNIDGFSAVTDFASTVSAAGNGNTTWILMNNQALSGASYSLPSNCTLMPVSGASLYRSGATSEIHFYGPVQAPLISWIDESSVSAYFHDTSVYQVHPVWFGASSAAGADEGKNRRAIKAAADSFSRVAVMDGFRVNGYVPLNNENLIDGYGIGGVTVTADTYAFYMSGTSLAFKTDITIQNLHMEGTQASFTNKAIGGESVKRLRIQNNTFRNISPVFLTLADSFANISDSILNEDISITGNRYDNNSLDASGGALIFVRFAKHGVISNNILKSRSGVSQSQAIEIYGGDGNPASQGTLANDAKCHSFTIANNTMEDMAAGIAVSQSHNVTVQGNVAKNCHETYWSAGRTYDITWVGNTDEETLPGSRPFQTQGIVGHTVVKGNVFRINSLTGTMFWIGPTWESLDNNGPVIVEGNTFVSGTTPIQAEITSIGKIIFRGNTWENVLFSTSESTSSYGVGQIDINGDTFKHSVVGGTGTTATYFMRLADICDKSFSGVAGTSPYATVQNCTFQSEVVQGSNRYHIYPNDFNDAGTLTIKGNTFLSPDVTHFDLVLSESGASQVRYVIEDNVFTGKIQHRDASLGANAKVVLRNNKDINGRPYYNSEVDHSPDTTSSAPIISEGSFLEGRLVLGDDTATNIGVNYNKGVITIMSSEVWASGSVLFDAAGSGASSYVLGGGPNIAASTGALAGNTGTDSKVTISPHTDGGLYIENRTGAQRTFRYRIHIDD